MKVTNSSSILCFGSQDFFVPIFVLSADTQKRFTTTTAELTCKDNIQMKSINSNEFLEKSKQDLFLKSHIEEYGWLSTQS